MLPFKLIYDDGYDLNLGPHVFPSHKFTMIRDRLLADGTAHPHDLLMPDPATDEDMLLVHTRDWITRLKAGTLDYLQLHALEIPYSRQMVEAFYLATGGSILAARRALTDGIGFNIGGGFHHAYSDHGEGFCAINDVAVAIRRLQSEKLIERALIIDVDVHHGNGTAAIFAADPTVFTLSIHQYDNYPSHKPPSTLDIHLPNDVGDSDYLARLSEAASKALADFQPQLVMYIAGADPYREDQLGGLNLTIEGLKQRDRLVFDLARAHNAAIAITLAGGYAHNVEDTVTIHCNTVRAAAESVHQSRTITLGNANFESKLRRLFDLARAFGSALEHAAIPYRVVGGVAVFLHVDTIDPMAARLTPDVDICVDRKHFDALRSAAERSGFKHARETQGDIFFLSVSPSVRSAVHLIFAGEKVRPEYLEPVPFSEPIRTTEGILIAPVADLVRMKLTSFRLKDKVHIQDMDSVGLITPEIELDLPQPLRDRLTEVRATE
ncbi:MAG TPA: histone deacetylase [Bryobacteraceae bacterium]